MPGRRSAAFLLTPKAFAVLAYLVEHAGCLVTLEEFFGGGDRDGPPNSVSPLVLAHAARCLTDRVVAREG